MKRLLVAATAIAALTGLASAHEARGKLHEHFLDENGKCQTIWFSQRRDPSVIELREALHAAGYVLAFGSMCWVPRLDFQMGRYEQSPC